MSKAQSRPRRTIKLGSPALAVVEVQDVAEEMRARGYRAKRNEDLDGAYLPSDETILVRQGLSRRARAATILHELLHACGLDDEKTTLQIEIALTPVLLRQGWSP